MPGNILGIHHITAIASDPQQNLDFYTRVLGLRLVKITVNFDDPGTYHFYYGDSTGTPGTILTFYPWSKVQRGQPGVGSVCAVGFQVPIGSFGFWTDHLRKHDIIAGVPFKRFNEEVLAFTDYDGLNLELVAREGAQNLPFWHQGPVDGKYAIRAFAEPTLMVGDLQKSAAMLMKTFGLSYIARSGLRHRFCVQGQGFANQIDLLVQPEEIRGKMGAGVVHHIAWRAPQGSLLADWRKKLSNHVFNVSPVQDRRYFHSIHFREPGGILFEVSTDPPSFTVDEPAGKLGTNLMLPPWLEERRQSLLGHLPPLYLANENIMINNWR